MESSSSEDLKGDQLFSSVEHNIENINKILYTITLKCKEEMEKKCLDKPLEDYIERVACYTGLSKRIIIQFICENQEIDTKNKYFHLNDRIEIFKYIADMHSKAEIPTYRKIFIFYKKIEPGMTFPQFQYMMSCLGFEYRKAKSGKEILIEDPSQTFKRYLYLKQIMSFRAKCAPVYYIDERFVDSTYSFVKPQVLSNDIDTSLPGCNGYVFFHAVSQQGFLSGLFCSPGTKKDFVKWISHILIPLLSRPSVIVLSNNDFHRSSVDSISKYHSRNDMLQYLRQRNIPCNENLHKAELYELITKCTVKHNSYDVDEILKAHGHFVLRLPTNFHDLSITHYLWKYIIESEPDLYINVELSQIKPVLLEGLSRLSKNLWASFHEALVVTEQNILNVDLKAQNALDTYNLS